MFKKIRLWGTTSKIIDTNILWIDSVEIFFRVTSGVQVLDIQN